MRLIESTVDGLTTRASAWCGGMLDAGLALCVALVMTTLALAGAEIFRSDRLAELSLEELMEVEILPARISRFGCGKQTFPAARPHVHRPSRRPPITPSGPLGSAPTARAFALELLAPPIDLDLQPMAPLIRAEPYLSTRPNQPLREIWRSRSIVDSLRWQLDRQTGQARRPPPSDSSWLWRWGY